MLYDTREGKFTLNIYKDHGFVQQYNFLGEEDVIEKHPSWAGLVSELKELAKEDLREPDMKEECIEGNLNDLGDH